MVTGGAKLAER